MSSDHSHPHHHKYDHHHHAPNNKAILALSFAIIGAFMVVEFLGGWYFKSLALLADAAHMANDSFSLLLALLALFLSRNKQRWFVAVYILYEAIRRWHNPLEMMALPMIGVATLGLFVNILVAWLMMKGDQENLNMKAAYLHVLADMFGSMVAIVAGLSAWLLGWMWVDVVASAILSVFIFKSGWGIVHRALSQLRGNDMATEHSHHH